MGDTSSTSASAFSYRALLFFLLALISVLLAPLEAISQTQPKSFASPMTFTIVRSSEPGCEPTCPEWIAAEGTIVAETPARLKSLLKSAGGRRLPVVITSPGGDVDAAISIGRMIRQFKLDTAVGTTRYRGCQPANKDCNANRGKAAAFLGTASQGDAFCASACPLMLAGGLHRLVGEWAYLGVHQITTTYVQTQVTYRTRYKIVGGKKRVVDTKVVGRKEVGSFKTYEMDKSVETKVAAYLEEMGIDHALIDAMKSTPASDMRQIPPFDQLKWKLVTGLEPVDALTGIEVCRIVPAAANCRLFSTLDLKE
jgi:hypothetical protein